MPPALSRDIPPYRPHTKHQFPLDSILVDPPVVSESVPPLLCDVRDPELIWRITGEIIEMTFNMQAGYRLSRSSHQDRFVLSRFLIPLRDAVGCSSSDGDRYVCLASGGMLTYNGY